MVDSNKTYQFINNLWDTSVIGTLSEYVKIPNQSPAFDPNWKQGQAAFKAVEVITNWIKAQNVPGLKLEIHQDGERSHLIFMEVEATIPNNTKTVMLYGHFDKQPPMTNDWEPGLGPYTPVIRDDKLYGRGASDDGYAAFSAISAILALKQQNIPHARFVIIIEGCEESGSPDLAFYIDKLLTRIGDVSLVVCLDSGCGNYEQFWMTSSLRGLTAGTLTVKVLKDGVHSGHASGIVPSSFRISRQLLSRLEDEKTGAIIAKGFQNEIPPHRLEQCKSAAVILGQDITHEFPWVHEHSKPVHSELSQLVLNRTWQPALAVTGQAGLPALADAGNVLRTHTSLKLSLRLPPNVDALQAAKCLKELLEKDPPYGAQVIFNNEKAASGWDSPNLAPWLHETIENASKTYFNKGYCSTGEGGSIPFMGMLGEKFPKAQFVVTGVLGPKSNAHGPNEFLHIPMAKKVTSIIAIILAAHAKN